LKILLVVMPSVTLTKPSLSLGILEAVVRRDAPEHEVSTRYANLEWAEHLFRESAGWIDPVVMRDINGLGGMLGDWVFSGALRGFDDLSPDAFEAVLGRQGVEGGQRFPSERIAELRYMFSQAPAFIEALADDIAAGRPDVVGMSTSFMQVVSSLSLAQALKRRLPGVATVLGGAACDGDGGAALVAAYPFIDFAVSGEAEDVLPRLLAAVAAGERPDSVPSTAYRGADGAVRTNPAAGVVPASRIPRPSYDAYFEAIGRLDIGRFIDPQLNAESSRGCWWGERSQCTFCGFNATSMRFRSKDPAVFLSEVEYLSARHGVLDMMLADAILDMRYFDALLPALAALPYDIHLHYEVKSNLPPARVRQLAAAGITRIQPGIESLVSDALRRMRKGVRSTHNVALLRDALSEGIFAQWNWLYGMVDENPAAYDRIVGQVPNLVHLQPPTSAFPIMLHRYSPYFIRRDELFDWSEPHPRYRDVYGEGVIDYDSFAYFYRHAHAGIAAEPVVEALDRSVDDWIAAFPSSSLVAVSSGGGVAVHDRRSGREPRIILISDEAEAAAFRALLDAQDGTASSVRAAASRAGFEATAGQAQSWLDGWRRDGLVFEDEGFYTALPTRRGLDRLKPGCDWSRPIEPSAGVLAIGSGAWPSAADLDRLAADGVHDIRVDQQVDIDGMDGLGRAGFTRFLRDAQPLLIAVDWSSASPVIPPELAHLQRPRNAPASEAFRFDLLSWRQGPGFVHVRDARHSARYARHVLRGDLMRVFLLLAEPASAAALASGDAAAADDLVALGLAARFDGHLLALPVHQRLGMLDGDPEGL
jgi:ribosomal peptide maturation radical SAM protein 1